ncbi:MAG: DUF7482 domain-containing protein [Longimicrobiales bacterium]
MQGIIALGRATGFFGLVVGLTAAACEQPSPVQPDTPVAFSMGGGPPPFVFPAGCCYYEGRIVRTVVPPARSPKPGLDNFYAFPSSAAMGQKGVVAVAPGDTDYHGGHWKFHAVTWNVTPYLLTSEAAVLAAAAAGDVTVTRVPSMDFKCPIQP